MNDVTRTKEKKVPIPKKGYVSRQPALGFGDITVRWISPTMIELQEKTAGSDEFFLMELDEARALRDWLNKADL